MEKKLFFRNSNGFPGKLDRILMHEENVKMKFLPSQQKLKSQS